MLKKQVLVLLATAILVWDTQVFAEPEQLDTITVTAQKQEERVQDVPMSITVLDSQAIEDQNIDSLGNLADLVPNFYLNDEGMSGMNAPSMRGIYANATTLNTSVGLFIDGVPVLSPAGFEDLMLDVQRVEVLRGPQGTLYGKNTEAGAINIITRQPDNEFRARLSAEAGKLLSCEAGDGIKTAYTASLSGPIQKDKLFFGFAGQFYQKDGFIENTLTGDTADDKAHGFGRAHLLWTPTDRIDISLIASMTEYDDDAPYMSFADAGAAMFGLPSFEYRKISPDLEGSNKANSNSQSLKIKYNFSDALTLTSITARRVYNDEAIIDWDFSPYQLMHSDKDNQYTKISQELRLDGSSEKINWLVGLYYDKDKNEFNIITESDYPSMASISDRDFTGDAYAIFGQAGYAFTPKLKLTGGLRYEIQNQEYENYVSVTKTDDSWDEISPKLAVEYRFTPAWMTWISATKGYRSGGFNTFATDPAYISYDEETLWSYEVGSKTAFWDNRLIFNACLFYMDITDMQVTDAVTATQTYLTNAAKARSMGIELETTARVTESLTLVAGFGYNNVEFDDFTDAYGDYTGNNNPYAPEYTFNIGAQYRHESGFFARADLIGYGEMFLDKANLYSRDAFLIVNAKIGYETDHFDIYLYGKNIFDQEYDSVGYYEGYYTVYSDPGEVGLQLTYRF